MFYRHIDHYFSSKLTDYGRGNGLKIHEIPYSEAQRIYEEQAKDKLPLTDAEFREVISAEFMVFGRKGLGGPQTEEVKRKLADGGSGVDDDAGWRLNQISGLTQSQLGCKKMFAALSA